MWLRSSWVAIRTRFVSFAAKKWAMCQTMRTRVFNKLKSCHAIIYFTRVVCVRGFSGSKRVRRVGRPYCGWTRRRRLTRPQRRLPHPLLRLVVQQPQHNPTNHRQAPQRLRHITFLHQTSLRRLNSGCPICRCHLLVFKFLFFFIPTWIIVNNFFSFVKSVDAAAAAHSQLGSLFIVGRIGRNGRQRTPQCRGTHSLFEKH